MPENATTTTVEEMRERIRAAFAGESDVARRAAISAVEGWRAGTEVEDTIDPWDDLAMEYAFENAFFEFHLFLQEGFLDEAPEMSDEEYDALPKDPTRANQWGIEVSYRDADEAMKEYWFGYRDAELAEDIS